MGWLVVGVERKHTFFVLKCYAFTFMGLEGKEARLERKFDEMGNGKQKQSGRVGLTVMSKELVGGTRGVMMGRKTGERKTYG
jgi:hypothetical protein